MARRIGSVLFLLGAFCVYFGFATACSSHEGAAESANALEKAKNAIPLKDPDTVRRVQQALNDIDNGTHRYRRDGIPFQNREGILPNEPPCYYKEYTVQPQAGVTNRGSERLVVGRGGEVYYTPNHYSSFVRIR
jgi:ribonuclease T1